MEQNKKYIEFLLNTIIDSKVTVQLPSPQQNGKAMWVKLGPIVNINVDLEVIEKYSRSVSFKLKFDRYEIDQLIFFPINSSPISIREKLIKNIEKLVYKTFIDDGRREDIIKMYEEKRGKIISDVLKAASKIKELNNSKKGNYIHIKQKHLPYLGLLNFEGDLFRAYDLLDGRFTIVNEKREEVVTTDARGILDYMEGDEKPIVNYDGKIWIIQNEHRNAKPSKEALYKFLRLGSPIQ